jgi:DNA polymerase III alpha subunit (gram-positive type)
MADGRLVALDTETTGLDPDTERVFEVAAIDLATGQEHVWRFEPPGYVVDAMHPKALEVNRYHERTSAPGWRWDDAGGLVDLAHLLTGAHLVGAVPDFDARHLAATYLRFGLPVPRWHYHLIDVETMAVGWLRGTGLVERLELPWESDYLSELCGVDPPGEGERHTALGDARWVARWYRRVS